MIRKAKEIEFENLNEISLLSKSCWKYSPEQMKIFKKELKITSEYIKQNQVWIYEKNNRIIAYYSLKVLLNDKIYTKVTLKKGFWLDHFFVHPNYLFQGIGTDLFNHLKNFSKLNKIDEIKILADPNSKKFYEKMGCIYISEYPSSIENRTTPYFEYKIV
jgi:N-acetylglutamate synthase-like GNAT family acetyltransferase